MNRETAILTTLIAYKAVLIGIGVFTAKRNQTAEDFFLGGRKLGAAVAALSASASSSSAWTLLGVSGAAYAWGLSALWIFPACVGGFLFNWYILAPAIHRLSHREKALTTTEILTGPRSTPLHKPIVWIASTIILIAFTAYVAAQFQGAGKAFQETFGLDLTTSILIGAAIILVYTLLGGFWAVSITDTLQGCVMAGASILLPAAVLFQLGGISGLVDGMRNVDAVGFLSPFKELETVAGLGFVLGLLGIGLGYPGQPHVVNRFMAIKNDEKAVKQAKRIALAWAIIVYAGMLLLGLGGRILYPDLADQEVIFMVVTKELFHPIVAGVLLAAVLSAIMSTADSQLLVAASSLSYDVRNKDKGSRLVHSRWVVIAITLAAAGFALVGSQEIFSRVLFAWTALGAAFGPPLILTALKRRPKPGWMLMAISLGFLLSVAAYSFPATQGTIFERVLPFAVSLFCSWQGSRSA